MSRVGAAPGGARAPAALALLAMLLALPLVLRGALPPDEVRYAGVAASMLETGSWAVPTLFGELYREKPPVFFWAAAALSALGVPVGAAPRLVSLVSAVGVAALLPGIGAALGVPAPAARRAALVLATTPLFLGYAQMGLLDTWLTLLVTGAIAAKLLRARARRRAPLAVAEGALLGAALLTKGPVALLYPLGLRAGALAARLRTGAPDRSDVLALGVALAVGACWLLAAWAEAGRDYVVSITLGQVTTRVGGGAGVPHPRPAGYLLAVTLAGLVPWLLFAPRAVARLRATARPLAHQGTGPLLGWLALPVLLLSALPSQQPHYALPSLPAAALLLAPATCGEPSVALRRALGALGALVVVILLGVAAGGPGWVPEGGSRSEASALLLGDPIVRGALGAAGVAIALLVLAPGRIRALLAGARTAAALAALFAGVSLLMGRLDVLLAPRALLARPEISGAGRLVASENLRNLIRLSTANAQVDVLDKDGVREQLLEDPSLVALVWEKDYGRRVAPSPRDRLPLEVIGRGWFQGAPLLALRARRPEAAPPAEAEAAPPAEAEAAPPAEAEAAPPAEAGSPG